MDTHEPGTRLQMIYRCLSYFVILFGGTVSGALAGSVSGPIQLTLSVADLGTLGAFLGAFLALAGCKFAIERSEAKKRNRELIHALDCRLSRLSKESELSTSYR